VGEPRLVTVGEPLDERVLVLVTERDGVEDTLGQCEPTAVRLPVEETRAVPVRRADAVALGDAEGVLDPDMLREPVAQLVGLREDVVEDVVVFDGGAVREPVPHADAVRVADMVRVPLGEPEGDFDADMDPVAVALRLPVPDSRADSEKEGEPVDVFDAVTVREPVGVPEPVLLALAERLGEGVPVDVREVDTEADAVLVGATVRVEVVLPVAVFEPAVDAVSAGEEDAVLEEDVVFVAVMDAVVVFVEVVEAVHKLVGRELLDRVVVFVDVLLSVALLVGTTTSLRGAPPGPSILGRKRTQSTPGSAINRRNNRWRRDRPMGKSGGALLRDCATSS